MFDGLIQKSSINEKKKKRINIKDILFEMKEKKTTIKISFHSLSLKCYNHVDQLNVEFRHTHVKVQRVQQVQ